MKYFKRLNLYKGNNVTFHPETCEAFSYRWWRFVAIVEGKLVFNDYRYSVTTAKHQRKVRGLLNDLGIRPDITMPLPRGIRHDQTLAQLITEAEEELCGKYLEAELKRETRNERARARRAEKRALANAELKANLDALTGEQITQMRDRIRAMKEQGMTIEQMREAVSHE